MNSVRLLLIALFIFSFASLIQAITSVPQQQQNQGTDTATVQDKFLNIEQAANSSIGAENSILSGVFQSNSGTRQPVIGILTQPISERNKNTFRDEQYVLEINKIFIELSGARAIFIQYDLTETQMLETLSKINGVLFTGGGLTLINQTTGEIHPYYNAAKIIYKYSLQQKDQFGVTFPILGVCQGYQLLTMLVAGDINLLMDIPAINQTRTTQWIVKDPKTESKVFQNFDPEIIRKFETERVAFHFHDWGVSSVDFNNNQNLKSFFKILQTDTITDPTTINYVASVEAFNYPIFGMIYHPEYQLLPYDQPFNNSNGNDTFKIAKAFSDYLYSLALLNPNQPDLAFTNNLYSFANFPLDNYKLNGKLNSLTPAYGIRPATLPVQPQILLDLGNCTQETCSTNQTSNIKEVEPSHGFLDTRVESLKYAQMLSSILPSYAIL